jgi:hypothetical protein
LRSALTHLGDKIGPLTILCAAPNVSDFDQTPRFLQAQAPGLRGAAAKAESTVMSEASEFWMYAEEALRWAQKATTEKEQAALRELVNTWTQAALASEHPMPMGVNYSPTDHRTAL